MTDGLNAHFPRIFRFPQPLPGPEGRAAAAENEGRREGAF